MKRFGSLILLGSFIEIASCCLYAKVKSFSNKNKVTDYITSQDEITMRFGVGQLVAYQYSNFYEVD